jgi:uncharacterized spore protein YtfJ
MDPQQILIGAQESMAVRRVFGDPIQAEGATIIPAAVIGGGGGGGGRESPAAGGVGFGITARPAGVVVIKQGDVTWRPAINVNLIIAGAQLVAITALLALRPLLLNWGRRRLAA